MLLFAAALIASPATSVPRPNAGASVQAIATIRVISGARINLRSANDPDVPRPRDTVINTGTAQQQRARLIEFQ